MHHFEGGVRQGFDLNLHRFLAAGEVILRAVAQTAEDRGLHFDQAELLLQLAGEEGFDLADLLLFLDKLFFIAVSLVNLSLLPSINQQNDTPIQYPLINIAFSLLIVHFYPDRIQQSLINGGLNGGNLSDR